jgi:outer membrane protein
MRILLLALLPLACQYAQERLTLGEAEATALRQNPRLRSAVFQTAASRAQVQQVKGTLQPFAAANVTSSIADHGSRIGAGGLNASSIFSRFGAGLALNQTLYDFGRTSKLAESASTRADAQASVEDQTRGQIRWEVRQAYIRVLGIQKTLEVARATIATRELTRRQIQALVDSQLRSTLDLQFAEVIVGEAEVTAARLEGDLSAAQAALSSAMGFVESKIYVLAELSGEFDWTDDPESLVREALSSRPDITARKRLSLAARQFAESERRLILPSVSAAGAFGFIPAGDPRLQSRYGGLGVNLNIPLFNGHTFEARRQEADARADATDQDLRDLELRVSREVRTAFADASNVRRRIALTEKQLAQTRRLLSMAKLRYTNGLSTIVEVNQAELAQLSGELAATAARYDFALSCATLDFVAGRLR